MSVTDGDRERARELADLAYQGGYDQQFEPKPRDITDEQVIARIAAALAEEREKTRAQFCALLAVSPTLVDGNDNPRGYLVSLPLLSTLGITASDIDHAVEETTE